VFRLFSSRLVSVIAALLVASAAAAHGAEPAAKKKPAREPATKPIAELSATDAIVLGVVEGVTEFLPVSSTGHLIIANHLLGLESDQPLTNAAGEPLWYKKPSEKNPAGEPLTLKLAADTYTVVIQVGAILAVVFMYWSQLVNMLIGLFGRSSSGFRLLRNVLLAFAPVAVIGFLLHDLIDKYLFSIWAVVAAQIGGAVIMLWAERWRKKNSGIGFSKGDPADMTPGKAVGIGFAQCLALWPGTSRSMVTIVGGYLAGLTPVRAAEFSFLVGLPTLAGAAVYKSFKSGPAMIEVFGWSSVLLGCVVAAVSAVLAVKFFVRFLSRNGLAVFAFYRIAVAIVLAAFFLF